MFKELGEILGNLQIENCKLKAALESIKEIAEMQCVCGVNCQDMKIILQKISEVLNDG